MKLDMMSRRTLFPLAAFALVILAIMPAAAQTAAPDPLPVVKALYNPKTVGWDKRPLSKRLMGLYKAAVKKSEAVQEPVSGLDFDPATGAQDADDGLEKRVKLVREPLDQPGKAKVIATMRLFKADPETSIHVELVLEGNAWKIDDIYSPAKTDGWRWSELLIAGAKGQ